MFNHQPESSFDVSNAVAIHIRLRNLLEDYIIGNSKQPPDPKLMCCNTDCPLAKWLHNQECKGFKDIRLLNQICNSCEKFQTAAFQAVLLENMGKDQLAKEALRDGGAFCEASAKLQREFTQLRSQLHTTIS